MQEEARSGSEEEIAEPYESVENGVRLLWLPLDFDGTIKYKAFREYDPEEQTTQEASVEAPAPDTFWQKSKDPCPVCLKLVDPTKFSRVTFPCCERQYHANCRDQTLWSTKERAPMTRCPECMRIQNMESGAYFRRGFARKYRDEHCKVLTISPNTMLKVLQRCGLRGETKSMIGKLFVLSQVEVDEIYREYKTLRVVDLLEKEITITDFINWGYNLTTVMDHFTPSLGDLVPLSKDRPNLGFLPAHLEIFRHEAPVLLDIGLNARRLRELGIDLKKLRKYKLPAPVLMILGFSFYEMVLMKLTKDQIQHFKFSQDDWFKYLGMDKQALTLLSLREKDFESTGMVPNWSVNYIKQTFNLTDSELTTFIVPNLRGSGDPGRNSPGGVPPGRLKFNKD